MYAKGLTRKFFKYKDGLEVLSKSLENLKDVTNSQCYIFDEEMSIGFDKMLGMHRTQIHKFFLERLEMVQKSDKHISLNETPLCNLIEIPNNQCLNERQTPLSVQCNSEWIMSTKHGPLEHWLRQNCDPGDGNGWKWANILNAVSKYILSKKEDFFSLQNITFCLIQSDGFFSEALGVNSFHRSEIQEILLNKLFVTQYFS